MNDPSQQFQAILEQLTQQRSGGAGPKGLPADTSAGAASGSSRRCTGRVARSMAGAAIGRLVPAIAKTCL
jgi:hypothetical protein